MSYQKGNVTVTAWKDNKVVRVMSTTCDPNNIVTVVRQQKDGTKESVPCPQNVHDYNVLMSAVDFGDQLRGYYRCRTKFRKFYMYIFSFLKDVAITNSFILFTRYVPSMDTSLLTIKTFRLQLAKELIGDYCSRKLPGRFGVMPKPLPLLHYPLKHPRGGRGRCKLCATAKKLRKDTSFFCQTCNEWLCHTGNLDTDCFFQWHKAV